MFGKLKRAGWRAELSHLDPELKHFTGGVAALTRKPAIVDLITPRSTRFAALVNSGRVQLFAVEVGLPIPLLLFVIYGWTGGATMWGTGCEDRWYSCGCHSRALVQTEWPCLPNTRIWSPKFDAYLQPLKDR